MTAAPTLSGSRAARIGAQIADPTWQPTRDQVADLIRLLLDFADDGVLTYDAGHAAGYRARVAEENAAWPPPDGEPLPIYAAGTAQLRMTRAELRDADRHGRWPDRPRPTWAGYLDKVEWPPVRRPGTEWRRATGTGWPP